MNKQVEQIKAEIERRKSLSDRQKNNGYFFARSDAYAELLNFIDSMPEEPVSEDMEAEFFRAVHNLREQPTLSAWFRHFYNLGKHQMMKDAVEGYVDMLEFPENTWIELSATPKDLKDGDKVKLIIIKEDKI